MTRKKARKVTHVRLDDESEQVLNQYLQSIGSVKKNKTECIIDLIASWGSKSRWKKMSKKFQPSLMEIVENQKLEVQRTELNRVLKKDTIGWGHLRPCLYRDLKGTPRCRNRKPPANLMTDDLRPDICERCQKARDNTLKEIREFQIIQRAFRAGGGKKISLIVGQQQEMELVKTERDDWKQRCQDEARTLQNKHHFMIKKRDAKNRDQQETIKQQDTSIGDLNLKIFEQQGRIKKLEAIVADPQKFEKLESENQTLKTQLADVKSELASERAKKVELIRKRDQLSKELVEMMQNRPIADVVSEPESLKTKNDEPSKETEIARNQESIDITTTTTTTVKLPQPIEKEKKKPVMVKCELDGKQKDMDIECRSCGQWKKCKGYARAMGLY